MFLEQGIISLDPIKNYWGSWHYEKQPPSLLGSAVTQATSDKNSQCKLSDWTNESMLCFVDNLFTVDPFTLVSW